jgi:hypothetical protein
VKDTNIHAHAHTHIVAAAAAADNRAVSTFSSAYIIIISFGLFIKAVSNPDSNQMTETAYE